MNNEQNSDIHSLSMPLFGVLTSLGHSEYSWFHHFDIGTLFWSLVRFFGFYHRTISVVKLERNQRPFLEADIESFIIRMRILQNDVAFIIRQLLPEQAQGLKGPKGGVHPRNKEMSMINLFTYFDKYPDKYHEIKEALEKNREWIFRLKDQRDNIIHYKSKVIVFETAPDISFASINAGNTEKTVETANGGRRVLFTPVFEYINSQTLSLHKFLQNDLVSAIIKYIDRKGMNYKKIGGNTTMTCCGIELFKRVNNINT